jgi:hypothetical protein
MNVPTYKATLLISVERHERDNRKRRCAELDPVEGSATEANKHCESEKKRENEPMHNRRCL